MPVCGGFEEQGGFAGGSLKPDYGEPTFHQPPRSVRFGMGVSF
jgi:hypothetical protein